MTLRNIGRILLVVGLGIGLIYGIIYVGGKIMSDTADFRGKVNQKERVKADGDYRIANYDMFYDLCGDIEAKNRQIENTEEQLRFVDGENKDKLQGSKFALEQQKEEMVQDYNSRSASNGTRGQYRASDLPYKIDPEDKEISCGS